MTTENTLTEVIEEAGLELRSGPLDIAIDRLKDAAARARKAEDRGADAPADDEVRAMLGSAEAVRSNAERIAALPDEVKLALFNAGLSARSTTVFRGNPFGHPPLADHEERAWRRYAEYLQARLGVSPEDVSDHLNWVVGHKNFRTPDEWLGEEGRRFRVREGRPEPSADFLAGWKRHSGESAPVQPPKEPER